MAEAFFKTLQDNKFSALFVTGSHGSFCSGGQLRRYASLTKKEEGLALNQRICEILDWLYSLPVPKLCYVNGLCFGGGVELVSAFDYVWAHPAALFGLWQRRVGLSFGWGGGDRLGRRILPQNLDNWLLSAQTLSAYKAKEIGVVNKIVLPDNVEGLAEQFLTQVLSMGSDNLAAVKNSQWDDQKKFRQLWMGSDHQRALEDYK